jgi:glycosyltransferase involved in cell wall biosynthesis
MHDAAAEMARRGFRVVVLTSGRGYEDPSVKYKPQEMIDGVEVVRLPLSSFGKKTISIRLLGQASFLLQCILRGLFVRQLAGILVSTSPPMCSIAALVIRLLRSVPIKFWVMDLNPDQMIALGIIRPGSLPARSFDFLNRQVLSVASQVVVLDRFMAQRLLTKRGVQEKLVVLPPWPHEDHLQTVAHVDNPFRVEHRLNGRFVFMYSGNMSLASPLTTILEAVLRLREDTTIFFMFIGGGLGKKEVEAVFEKHRPPNMAMLPYQPLSKLQYSLSAADVHVVALGNDMVGIIHPCKVYGAMAVARPILLLGPVPSHLSDILEQYRIGWQVHHGDVDGVVRTMQQIAATDPAQLQTMGLAARRAISTEFSKAYLCGNFCDVLERGI